MSNTQLIKQYNRKLEAVNKQISVFEDLKSRDTLHAHDLQLNVQDLEIKPEFSPKVFQEAIDKQLEEYKTTKKSLESSLVILKM